MNPSALHSGMAAAAFVAVTQLSTRDHLNHAHLVALALYALSLPPLISAAIDPRTDKAETWVKMGLLTTMATLLFLAATCAFFWSLNALIGWAFFLSVVVTVTVLFLKR